MKTSQARQVSVTVAKARWYALLRRVAKGEEFVITRRNRPVACFGPVRHAPMVENVFDRIREFRERHPVVLAKGETLKDLINAGRRI